MGLNTSYGAWDGSYSSFGQWREIIASKIGLNLDEMLGYGGEKEFDKKHDLTPLLNHSDCDGHLTVPQCKRVKRGLEAILKTMPEINMEEAKRYVFKTDTDWAVYKAKLFIEGCDQAIKENKRIEFH